MASKYLQAIFIKGLSLWSNTLVGWRFGRARWRDEWHKTDSAQFGFPASIISSAVGWWFRFKLSSCEMAMPSRKLGT